MTEPLQIFERMKTAVEVTPWPDIDTRVTWLRDLRRVLLENRRSIRQAVRSDFEKPEVEADVTEILPILLEIRTALHHLKSWTAPKRVRGAFPLWGLSTKIEYRPKGVVLIISPWNYPFNLTLGPLVTALAAGNRAVVKPSERVPNSSRLISEIIDRALPNDVAAVVEGDSETGGELLRLPFDHFFFTGGERVGRLVAEAAAGHLSTATLELGGKSPAVVDGTLDMTRCAEKIIRGKFLNAGQTCIAPDYVVVHDEYFDRFVEASIARAAQLERVAEIASPVDRRHARHLEDLVNDALSQGATIHGSDAGGSHLKIVTRVPLSCRLMREEIFGPILPVLRYRSREELYGILARNPTPLSTYVFSRNEEFLDWLSRKLPTGTVSVNETLLHFVHPRLPFGGVGTSGFGRSHGRTGFETFSNVLPVMRQHFARGLIPLVYPVRGRLQEMVRSLLFRIVGGKDAR